METNNMEMYEAPKVEIIEVEVEKGFAVSGGTEDYDQHPCCAFWYSPVAIASSERIICSASFLYWSASSVSSCRFRFFANFSASPYSSAAF